MDLLPGLESSGFDLGGSVAALWTELDDSNSVTGVFKPLVFLTAVAVCVGGGARISFPCGWLCAQWCASLSGLSWAVSSLVFFVLVCVLVVGSSFGVAWSWCPGVA